MDNQTDMQTGGQPEVEVAYRLAYLDYMNAPEMQAMMDEVWSVYNPAGDRGLYQPVIYALEEGPLMPYLILDDGVEQFMAELESNGQPGLQYEELDALMPYLILDDGVEQFMAELESNGQPGLQYEELDALAAGQVPGKNQTQRMFATLLADRFHQIEVINDANPLTSLGDNHMSPSDLQTWVMGAQFRLVLDVLLAFNHDDSKPAYYNEFTDKIAAVDGITEHDIAELLDQDEQHKLSGNQAGLSSHQRRHLVSLLMRNPEHPEEPSTFEWLAAMGGDYRTSDPNQQLAIHINEELAAKFGTSTELAIAAGQFFGDDMRMPTSVIPGLYRFRDTDSKVMQFADGTHISFRMSHDPDDGFGVVSEFREVDGSTWRRDGSGTYREYDAQGYTTGESLVGTIEADETSVRFFEGDSLKKLLVGGQEVVVPSGAVAVRTTEDGTTLIYDASGNTISAIKLDDSQSPVQAQYRYNEGLLQEVTDSDGNRWVRGENGMFHQQDQSGAESGNSVSGAQLTPPGSLSDLYGEDGMPQFTDVNQGAIGDCGVLSIAASIAANNPELIKSMIVDNGDGTFTVTFPGNSDQPITVSAPTLYETKHFAQARDGTAWVAVLEKALRYMPSDGFEIPFFSPSDPEDNATYHGQFTSDSAVELMTGHHAELQYFNILASLRDGNADENSHTTAEEAHETLDAAMADGRAVQALPKISGRINIGFGNDAGPIVTRHAYGVVAYDADARIITIYNPWGFPGLKYDDSSITTNEDGSFSMSLDRFMQLFTILSVETKDPLSPTE